MVAFLSDAGGEGVSSYAGGGVRLPVAPLLRSFDRSEAGQVVLGVERRCMSSNLETWRLTIAGTKGDIMESCKRRKPSAVYALWLGCLAEAMILTGCGALLVMRPFNT